MSIKVVGGEPKTIDLEDGLHKGKVSLIEARTPDGKDYSYLDIFVKLEDKDLELKVGYPLPKEGEGLSPKSNLGELVKRFTNAEIVAGWDYDLDNILSGKEVQFLTNKDENGFVRILKDTLKLQSGEAQNIQPEKNIPSV